MLGNGRLEALCFDGEKRLAHIRGKLRKKVWINQGDIILLSLRDYQDEKGDVILKYSADEARSLKAYGELPESAKINETDTYVSSSLTSCPRHPLLLLPLSYHVRIASHRTSSKFPLCWPATVDDVPYPSQDLASIHIPAYRKFHHISKNLSAYSSSPYRYGHEGIDDNVEFDEDRDGSSDEKDIDVDEI